MFSIFDISEYLLCKEAMNHEKLGCLCYLVYGWYYALFDIELFKTSGFHVNGNYPYDDRLFDRYKQYGNKRIKPSYHIIFDQDIAVFIDSVYHLYKDFQGAILCGIIKNEPPYKNALARRRLYPNETPVILKEDMKDYFRSIYKEK